MGFIEGLGTAVLTFFLALAVAFLLVSAKNLMLSNNVFQKSIVEKVVLSSDDVNKLTHGWDGAEYVWCLNGAVVNGTTLIVDDIMPAEIIRTNSDEVSFAPCRGRRVVGTIHNHNSGVCRLSSVDIYTFGRNNDYLVEGLACGSRKLVFFSPMSLDEPIILQENKMRE